MKKFFTILAAFGLAFALSAPVTAATAAPAKVLSKAILDKFIKDAPAIMDELTALGSDFEDQASQGEGQQGAQAFDAGVIRKALKAAYADAKVKAVMAKYGWGENFLDVYIAVVFGYTYAVFEENYVAYPMPEMKAYMDQIAAAVHADDIALVKANRARIEAALDFEG